MKLFKVIIKMLLIIYPKKRNRICVIDETPFSGSNPYKMYKYLKETIFYNDVYIIYKVRDKKLTLRDIYILASSFIFICSHSSFKTSKNTICIQTWHGVPLKAMNYLDKGDDIQQTELWHKQFNKADYILSSSDLYENIMSACIGIHRSKFVKTGFPRNDYLYNTINKIEVLSKIGITCNNLNKKILLYIPTFRIGHKGNKVEGDLKNGNMFSLVGYDAQEFDKLLETYDCLVIAKLHPMEEAHYSNNNFETNNLILINSEILNESKTDLYEILNIADGLITDYSSIYFDSLLKDIQLIFIDNDFSEYNKNRGFSLIPFDDWTPGPKVSDFTSFKKEVINIFNRNDDYKDQREKIKNLIFDDINIDSSSRIYEEIIKNIITQKK